MKTKILFIGVILISIVFLSACAPDNFAGQATRTKTVKTPYQQCTSETSCKNLYLTCLKSDCASFDQQKQKTEYGACQLSCLTKSIATDKLKTVPSVVQTASPLCGNNKKEGAEICDGTDLGSQTCISQSGVDGSLGCSSNCLSFDTNNCVYAQKNPSGSTCGNLKREYGEVCDGSDTGIENCESQNAGSGILGCKSDCKQFDFAGCKQ